MKAKVYLSNAVLLFLVLLTSCEPPKLGYFQNVDTTKSFTLANSDVVRIRPGDKLSILVSSKDPQLAYLFNLPVVGHYRSSSADAAISTTQVTNYTVNPDGTIYFPVLGAISIEGLSRFEIAKLIREKLAEGDLLKDAVVTVNFLDLYYEVLGEVKNAGRYAIDHDQVTILDAIGRAGDLTIFGKRENVLVAREENGVQKFYQLDLTNSDELFSSPAFYIKQNDIIYIEPNKKKRRESIDNGNAFIQPSFWISAISLTATLSVLIFK